MKKYHTYTVKARMLKLSQNVSNYHNSSSEVTRRVELAEGRSVTKGLQNTDKKGKTSYRRRSISEKKILHTGDTESLDVCG